MKCTNAKCTVTKELLHPECVDELEEMLATKVLTTLGTSSLMH